MGATGWRLRVTSARIRRKKFDPLFENRFLFSQAFLTPRNFLMGIFKKYRNGMEWDYQWESWAHCGTDI